MSYSLETLTAFSEALGALYAAESPAAALQATLPSLSIMLGSRHMFVDELPHDGRPPTPLGGLHMGELADAILHYGKFVHEHPAVDFVRKGGYVPVSRIRDFASAREFEQTGFYCEIFKPMEFRDQLCLAVRMPQSTIGITFHRDRPFTEDESYLVGLLQPHVAAAVQSSRRLQHARPADAGGEWDVPVALDGTPEQMGGELARLLARYFSMATNAQHLPDEVVRWLSQQAGHLRQLGPGSASIPAWVIARPGGRLLLHLAPSPRGPGGVLRVREERGAADFFRLRALGLTPRECEVAFWVAQGKRDAEVAVLLGCAVKTVSKHVENLLQKTGAETRAGATHAVQEWLRGNA